MEKKTETKLRTRFSAFGKTREDGRAQRDERDGPDGSRFHDTPPPYFDIIERARAFRGSQLGFSFSSSRF